MIYHSKGGEKSAWCDPYDLSDLDAEARCVVRGLKPHMGEFDVIVCTGLSGILPAVPAALRLGVGLAILRKPEDSTHQCGGAVFFEDGSKWLGADAVENRRAVWVDDFIGTGDTGIRMRRAVEQLGGKVVGRFLTQGGTYTPELLL